jgi:hypothetical protein
MGKNKLIKSLGKRIGNVVIHKILMKYTNKPESLSHLKSEVDTYRDNVMESSQEFNWSEKDKSEIKSLALDKFNKDIKAYYGDVRFPEGEPERMVDETIEECLP